MASAPNPGDVFGNLTVVSVRYAKRPNNRGSDVLVMTRCACGDVRERFLQNLRQSKHHMCRACASRAKSAVYRRGEPPSRGARPLSDLPEFDGAGSMWLARATRA